MSHVYHKVLDQFTSFAVWKIEESAEELLAQLQPYLANFPHFISLSHSFDYAAVMVSKDKAVGIDIELIKDKIERIAHKFMSKRELAFIKKDRIEQLYACWCAKEAIYKLHGKKNISFLDHIRIEPFDYSGTGSFIASLDTGSQKNHYTVHYDKFKEYMIGYVADNDQK